MKVEWLPGPESPTLASDEIHLWRVPLYRRSEEETSCRALLDAAEIDRAGRFHFERERKRFILRRGLLRRILSSYLEFPAQTIRLRQGPQGKPGLADEAGAAALQFNLSHSGELALIVLARNLNVGVDVEWIRPELRWLQIASRFFSTEEQRYLQSQDGNRGLQAFLTLWTRKEAWVKSRGEALAPHLNRNMLPEHGKSSRQPEKWCFWTLHPEPGYIATICAEGEGLRLRCFDFVVTG